MESYRRSTVRQVIPSLPLDWWAQASLENGAESAKAPHSNSLEPTPPPRGMPGTRAASTAVNTSSNPPSVFPNNFAHAQTPPPSPQPSLFAHAQNYSCSRLSQYFLGGNPPTSSSLRVRASPRLLSLGGRETVGLWAWRSTDDISVYKHLVYCSRKTDKGAA